MKDWTYETASDLDQSIKEQLKNFPREPGFFRKILRFLGSILIRTYLKIYHRFEITGQKNFPENASFIIVANHSSHLDAVCLLSTIPIQRLHKAFPAAAADYFFTTLPRAGFSSIFINALPFDREVNSKQSLKLCSALLETSGNILILFPEGTRSRTGEMGRFKSGISRLVCGTEIRVIPCLLEGCQAAWGKGSLIPKPKKIRVTIGKEMKFGQYPNERESMPKISEALQKAVRDLRSSSHR